MIINVVHMTACGHDFWYGYITPGGNFKDVSYLLKSGRFASSTDPGLIGDDPAEYDCEGMDSPGQWETKKKLVTFCKSLGFKVEFVST